MRWHNVDHHFQTLFMGQLQKPIKIGKGAVLWVYIAILRNIISEIFLRRCEKGTDPDSVNSKTCNVVQSFNNAVQISYAIIVAVVERSWINLINNT